MIFKRRRFLIMQKINEISAAGQEYKTNAIQQKEQPKKKEQEDNK
jgi:hypothetical protein